MEILDLIRGFLGFPRLGRREEGFYRGELQNGNLENHCPDCDPKTPSLFDPLGLHQVFENEMNRIVQDFFGEGVQGSIYSHENGIENSGEGSEKSLGSRDFMLNNKKGARVDSEATLSDIPQEEMNKFFEETQNKPTLIPNQHSFSFDVPGGQFQGSFFGSSVVEERTRNADGSMTIVRTERSSDGKEKKVVTQIDPQSGQSIYRSGDFPLEIKDGPSWDRDLFKRLFS